MSDLNNIEAPKLNNATAQTINDELNRIAKLEELGLITLEINVHPDVFTRRKTPHELQQEREMSLLAARFRV